MSVTFAETAPRINYKKNGCQGGDEPRTMRQFMVFFAQILASLCFIIVNVRGSPKSLKQSNKSVPNVFNNLFAIKLIVYIIAWIGGLILWFILSIIIDPGIGVPSDSDTKLSPENTTESMVCIYIHVFFIYFMSNYCFIMVTNIYPHIQHYCPYCDRHRLERTKHCRICDKCVPGFDHHCPVK